MAIILPQKKRNLEQEKKEIELRYFKPPSPLSKAAERRALEEIGQKPLRVPNASARRLSARLYPNGEFGVGCIPFSKKREEDKRQDRGIINGHEYEWRGRDHTLPDWTVLRDNTDQIQMESFKLGSACELSQKPKAVKKKYGDKGITAYGRRCVRNIGYMMERDCGMGYLQMGTLTIPSFDPDFMNYLCANWASLVKKFFQECKREHERCNKKWRYVAVTEIQPKRWKDSGEVGLHIHFLYRAYKLPKRGRWVLEDNWIRSTWHRMLQNLSRKYLSSPDAAEESVYVPVPNYRREQVNKNAAAYMAKYMSKGGDVIADVRDKKPDVILPSQWWSADICSRRELKKEIIVSQTCIAEFIFQQCIYGDSPYILGCNQVTIESRAQGEIVIGFSGRMSAAGMEAISALQT